MKTKPDVIIFGYTDRKGHINLVSDGPDHFMWSCDEPRGQWYPCFLHDAAFNALIQARPGEEVKPERKWLRKLTPQEVLQAYFDFSMRSKHLASADNVKLKGFAMCQHCRRDIYWHEENQHWYHVNTSHSFCQAPSKTQATPLDEQKNNT